MAAHLLEAAVEDMDYDDGKFFVKGSPDKAKTIQDIALMAHVAWNMPAGVEAGLEASMFYDPPNFTYPFGSHLAVVEVDPRDRQVELQALRRARRLRAADQPGDRRGTGARRRGAGHRPGAVGRSRSTTRTGQLVTGSMLDYALPARRQTARHRSDLHGHAVAASSARPERDRRSRDDCVDRRGLQRGAGRAGAARRRHAADADDARARVARDEASGARG